MIFRTRNAWMFEVHHDSASALAVAGEFNGWSATATPMTRDRSGVWRARLNLEPGTYRFRYVTGEGQWLTDWAAFGVIPNPFGEWDSVLYVPEAREIVVRPSLVETNAWEGVWEWPAGEARRRRRVRIRASGARRTARTIRVRLIDLVRAAEPLAAALAAPAEERMLIAST